MQVDEATEFVFAQLGHAKTSRNRCVVRQEEEDQSREGQVSTKNGGHKKEGGKIPSVGDRIGFDSIFRDGHHGTVIHDGDDHDEECGEVEVPDDGEKTKC